MSTPGGPQTDAAGSGRPPSHHAVMDRIYRHQRHVYDLTRRHYLAGRINLIRVLNAAPGERILEIGCGTAWNLIRIARLYPETRLCGVDASAEMLRSAEHAITRENLTSRIQLLHGLAEDVPALFDGAPPFDHVIFSYSLSMISDWRGALMAAEQIARPSGRIHVVDFGDLNGLWPAAAAILRGWLHLFHVQPRSEFLESVEQLAVWRSDCSIRLLPGRYAFVFQASKSAISEWNGTMAAQ